MKLLLILGALLAATPSMAYDAPQVDACRMAELLGDLQNSTALNDPVYSLIHESYVFWSDLCEELQDAAIDGGDE